MYLLALDIGLRRTGIAFGDTKSGFVVALDTLEQNTMDDCATHVALLVQQKKIDRLIVGLPLLPSGREGAQAESVRNMVDLIGKSTSLPVEFLDERYTTTCPRMATGADLDATAACAILTVWMDRHKAIDM